VDVDVDAACPDRRVFFPLLLLCCNSQFLMLLNFKHKHKITKKKIRNTGSGEKNFDSEEN